MPSYDHGVSGLTGTIGVTVKYPDGTAYAARATAGITEPVAGTGVYHYAHPAAGTLLLFIFDGGVGTVGGSVYDDGGLDTEHVNNKLVRTDNGDGTVTVVLYADDDSTPLKTWVYTTATGTRAKAT